MQTIRDVDGLLRSEIQRFRLFVRGGQRSKAQVVLGAVERAEPLRRQGELRQLVIAARNGFQRRAVGKVEAFQRVVVAHEGIEVGHAARSSRHERQPSQRVAVAKERRNAGVAQKVDAGQLVAAALHAVNVDIVCKIHLREVVVGYVQLLQAFVVQVKTAAQLIPRYVQVFQLRIEGIRQFERRQLVIGGVQVRQVRQGRDVELRQLIVLAIERMKRGSSRNIDARKAHIGTGQRVDALPYGDGDGVAGQRALDVDQALAFQRHFDGRSVTPIDCYRHTHLVHHKGDLLANGFRGHQLDCLVLRKQRRSGQKTATQQCRDQ